MNRLRITVGALIAVMLLAAATTFAFLYLRSQQVEQVETFNQELRNGLIASCEKNGNPLREAVQSLLRTQIKNSQNLKQLERFFPQIPPPELRTLTERQVDANQKLLHEIDPLDCEKIYPK